MAISSKESVGTWQELAAHDEELGHSRLRLIVLDPAVADHSEFAFPPDSIEARLMAISARIPAEVWPKLPLDLGNRLDHLCTAPTSHEASLR